MSDAATFVTLVLGFATTVTVSVLAPMLLNRQQALNRSAERKEDYARQDQVAAKTEETARLLRENTDKVTAQSRVQEAKLDQIHTLVNSNLTTALVNELASYKAMRLLLMEMLELKRSLNIKVVLDDPTAMAIREADTKIAELEAQLTDRLKQTNFAAERFASDMKEAEL